MKATDIFSCDILNNSESCSMENQACLMDKELEGYPGWIALGDTIPMKATKSSEYQGF